MNIPKIEIPVDLPDDARKLVEEVNGLLADAMAEVAEINNAEPDSVSLERRKEVLIKSEYAIQRFVEMRSQLRGYGLEWSEWPDLISNE